MVSDLSLFLAPPVLLTEQHDTASFDSGETVMDEWLRNRALTNQQLAASRTYVICPRNSLRIIAYFALSAAQILAIEVPSSMRRNMPRNIPAILLGRLAIDRSYQGKGLGRAILRDIVSRALRSDFAARLLIVHAISPDIEAFYVRHGFTRLPVQSPTYALDLVKLGKIGEWN